MARPEGFEPPTLCLEGRRSFQLSYGRTLANFSYYKPLRHGRPGLIRCRFHHIRQGETMSPTAIACRPKNGNSKVRLDRYEIAGLGLQGDRRRSASWFFREGTEETRNRIKVEVKIARRFAEVQCMQLIDDPEFYRSALDSVSAGVYLVDRNGKILFWNSSAERITGYLRQDMLGHSALEDFLGHLDGDSNQVQADALPVSVVLREGKASIAQVSIRHKSGHRVPASLHAAPIRDPFGELLGAVETLEDSVSAGPIHHRQSKLQAYGCLDEVSGVLNHAALQTHLRETLATFAESPVPFSILCIGVDNVEKIKTGYGAGAVATALRVIGMTLENSLRPTDQIGRWMGNEFVAVLLECGDDEVRRVAERLQRMANQCEMEWWGDRLAVTVSIGATGAQPADTVEAILQRAENALRECNRLGGSRVTVWDKVLTGGS
jgi:diguanylate cyclase (GGDEF)-like protein/PAS domain S-box-containing protein